MSVYLLTYDLIHKPEKDYEPVWKYIKSHPWAKLSESSYAIETNANPDQIWSQVRPLIHANDNFLIISLRRPWNGQNSKEVIDWLQAKLV